MTTDNLVADVTFPGFDNADQLLDRSQAAAERREWATAGVPKIEKAHGCMVRRD